MPLKIKVLNSQRGGGRGQWGEGFSGTTIKDTWTNQGGGWKQGREVGLAGVGGSGGEKMQTTLTEQQ